MKNGKPNIKSEKATKDCNLYDMVEKLRGHMEQSAQQSDVSPEDHFDLSANNSLISYYCELLEKSPSAMELLSFALKKNWTFTLRDLDDLDFTVDYESRVLELNHYGLSEDALSQSAHFRNAILFSMIRGLRDVQQDTRIQNILSHYTPQHMILIERMRCADMDTTAVLIAWELRNEEYSSLWRYLMGSEYGDMAMAFNRSLEQENLRFEGNQNFITHAMLSCFEQWFDQDKRVNECDREALDYIDSLMDCDMDVLYRPGQLLLQADQIEFFAVMVDQNSYLAGQGDLFLSNAEFATLRNDVNTAHFFQIMHDTQVTYRGGVAFRDEALAQKIFPEEELKTLH